MPRKTGRIGCDRGYRPTNRINHKNTCKDYGLYVVGVFLRVARFLGERFCGKLLVLTFISFIAQKKGVETKNNNYSWIQLLFHMGVACCQWQHNNLIPPLQSMLAVCP